MKLNQKLMTIVITVLSMGVAVSASAGPVQLQDGFTQNRETLCAQKQRATVTSLDGRMTVEVRAVRGDLRVWRLGNRTTVSGLCAATTRPLVKADVYVGGKAGARPSRAPATVAQPTVNNTLTVKARRIVEPDLAVSMGNGCYDVSYAKGITFQGRVIGSWIQCPARDARGNAAWKVSNFNRDTGRNEWAIMANTVVGGLIPAIITADAIKSSNGGGSGAATAVAATEVAVNVISSVQGPSCPGGCPMGGGYVID